MPIARVPPASALLPAGRHRRGLVLLIATTAAILALWIGRPGRTGHAAAAPPPAPLPVETVRLARTDGLDIKVRYPGVVDAGRAADLAFERAGRLAAVLADEGQAVAAGAVLARLDTADLDAQLRQAEGQLAQAEAGLRELTAGPRIESVEAARAQVAEAEAQAELARTQLARREDLLRLEAISREEMDGARTQVSALAARAEAARQRRRELETGTRPEQIDQQRAQVALARGRVDEVRVQIERSRLRAPFAGRIARRHLDEGAYAGPGLPVLSIVESGRPEIRVGLPADVAAALASGRALDARLGPHPARLTVTRHLPLLDESTRLLTVILAPPAELRAVVLPGMLAEIEVPRRLDEAGFRVPVAALTRAERGLWACYALTDDPAEPGTVRVERRDVEVIHADDAVAYIRGVVAAGDRLVASGVNRITDGQRVVIAGEREP